MDVISESTEVEIDPEEEVKHQTQMEGIDTNVEKRTSQVQKPKLKIDQRDQMHFDNLIERQHQVLSKILDELRQNGAKRSCWIWWVMPTEKPGNCEPGKTTCLTK